MPLSAFVDTNILVRHLTGDPPEQAGRATAFLGERHELLLTDLVAASRVCAESSTRSSVRGSRSCSGRFLASRRSSCSTPRCCSARWRSTRSIGSTLPRPISSPAPKPAVSMPSRRSIARSTASRPCGASSLASTAAKAVHGRHARGRYGDQSGEQIERNRAQPSATRTRSRPRMRSHATRSFRLGAGRSQVQILSPRSTRKACKCRLSGF